jgi:hypothetical protein
MDFSAISSQLSTSPLLAVGVLFMAGVLTSLTPCIYPMIPITAAIVGGQSVGETRPPRSRVVLLTLAYVAGLAIIYASLGVVAGMTGTIFGTISTNPWLYFAMANVLMLAALSMLDVIPVRLPAGLMQRASTAGTAGRASGAFVMGAVSGLVAAPCGAYLGYDHSARGNGLRLPSELLVWNVRVACSGGIVQWSGNAFAESGRLDGMGQARLRPRDDRCGGVLPCKDGSASILRSNVD